MLSITSRYALRALGRLARVSEKELILGKDLADQADVPSNYLAKILLSLRNEGIVETTRGTGGGYRLGRPPEDVRLIEVVELFEGSQSEKMCLIDARSNCSSEQPCSVHLGWERVQSVYLDFLNSTTLADIAQVPNGRAGKEETGYV
jgi:Rrf2 family iron-sulfur cluster assembly transcriptional regulator